MITFFAGDIHLNSAVNNNLVMSTLNENAINKQKKKVFKLPY